MFFDILRHSLVEIYRSRFYKLIERHIPFIDTYVFRHGALTARYCRGKSLA